MLDIIMDSLMDAVKLLPFLFLTYLAMEYMESHMSEKISETVKKAGKLGPLYGGILGMFPQCGFSAAGSNLYAGKIISVGTLIAIYMSTSDEMLPIFISENVAVPELLKVLFMKAAIGIFWGFAIDFARENIFKMKPDDMDIRHFCEREGCHCEEKKPEPPKNVHHLEEKHHYHGILLPSLRHTIKIFVYILIFNLVINGIIGFAGEEALKNAALGTKYFGIILTGIVGLIPNCAASIAVTQLYLEGIIGFPALITGLLNGAGVGLLILFKVNYDLKKNITIVGTLYILSVFTGLVMELLI